MTKDRMLHSFKVAEVIQILAEMSGMPKDACCKAFIIGLNHDIGYCADNVTALTHNGVGATIMSPLSKELAALIQQHGQPDTNYAVIMNGVMLFLLDIADNSVTGNGKLASYPERLLDISKRCPPEAIAYTKKVHENMRKFGESCMCNYPQLYKVWVAFDNGDLKPVLEKRIAEQHKGE